MSGQMENHIIKPYAGPANYLIVAGVVVLVLPDIHIRIMPCLRGIYISQANAAEQAADIQALGFHHSRNSGVL